MPGSVRSHGSKRSSIKRRRGPSSVKTDTSSRSRVHKRMRDIDLSGKVLGYISQLPSKYGDGHIIVRGMKDFRAKQFRDLSLVQSDLDRAGKWPAPRDQAKAVSDEFANIVDEKQGYQALGLKWKLPEGKRPEEVATVNNSQLDDLVLLEIDVRHGVGYAIKIDNLSAQIRLRGAAPAMGNRDQHLMDNDWDQHLMDSLEDRRTELKRELKVAKAELNITLEDCRDDTKPENDYRNGTKRLREICDWRKRRAARRIPIIERNLRDVGITSESQQRAPRYRAQGDPYDDQERGRPRRREEYPRTGGPQHGGVSRGASYVGRAWKPNYGMPIQNGMFPGADRRAEIPPAMFGSSRRGTPLGSRAPSRMQSFNSRNESFGGMNQAFPDMNRSFSNMNIYREDFDDETYFSQPNSRAASLSRSRSRSASMRPRPRMGQSSFWSTDSFPPPRAPRRPRLDRFDSRSYSMPRQPSFYGGAYGGYYGGPPPLSRMPSRSASRGGGYRRRYVSDTGSVVDEESYNQGGWNVRISNRSRTSGGASTSRRNSVIFH